MTPEERDIIETSLRIADHPPKDYNGICIAYPILDHLLPGEDWTTGPLRILAARVRSLEGAIREHKRDYTANCDYAAGPRQTHLWALLPD